jgi:hypothetical protein
MQMEAMNIDDGDCQLTVQSNQDAVPLSEIVEKLNLVKVGAHN